MRNLLVVDDDYKIRTLLHDVFSDRGYNVGISRDGKAAVKALKSKNYNIVISDLSMPKLNGVELLKHVKKHYPEIGFIMLTGFGTIPLAVESMQKGAIDFVTKPFSISQIESIIKRYYELRGVSKQNNNSHPKYTQKRKYGKIIGNSKEIRDVINKIKTIADKTVPVFIQGESGTGKELVAEAIHANSLRSEKPFSKINCTAIPETLFESILFGYEKGAFTGAIGKHKGIFEVANGCTLLLDEITEIPVNLQAKLLRVLQEGSIIPVGGNKEIPVDVRIIATSNMNIHKLIEEGKFRPDLFHRLNVFPIIIPPLRERRGDINVLLDYFLNRFKEKYGFNKKKINQSIRQSLIQYDWPGNVRELRNVTERAILNSGKEKNLIYQHFSLDSNQLTTSIYENSKNMPLNITEMEEKLIFTALRKTLNHRSKAAKLLGITARTLRNKLHQYQLESKDVIQDD